MTAQHRELIEDTPVHHWTERLSSIPWFSVVVHLRLVSDLNNETNWNPTTLSTADSNAVLLLLFT